MSNDQAAPGKIEIRLPNFYLFAEGDPERVEQIAYSF